jgi:hypothetical protein
MPWLVGCNFTNHAFRDGTAKNTISVLALAPAPAGPGALPPATSRPKSPCDRHPVHVGTKVYNDAVATVKQPCIAFLEFDDMGEPFDRRENHQGVGSKRWGVPHQLEAALDLIKDTRTYARQQSPPLPAPIILVFVHGWKHNASESDLNVQGFEQVVRFIAGQKVDSLAEGSCEDSERSPLFRQRCEYAKHPIIGIYVGWRGDLYNKYLPVAQDLSYFNREGAAERTGADNVTHALMSISTAAGHGADAGTDDPNPPFLLFIGHSFGGLVLERAVSQAFLREIDRQSNIDGFLPFADLIVYVNSAAAATFSKPMVDILAQRKAVYSPTHQSTNDATDIPSRSINESEARPLILSVSTPADAATAIILPVGQNIGSISKHLGGSFVKDDPLACFDPYHDETPKDRTYKQSLFYTHSAPHLEQLRSHDVIELVDAQHKSLESCPQTAPPGVLKMFDSVAGRCFALKAHEKRCNGTPYWILQTDKSIIPDHGTIFTGRFISFLSEFFPAVTPDASYTVRPLTAAPVTTPGRSLLSLQPPTEPHEDQ